MPAPRPTREPTTPADVERDVPGLVLLCAAALVAGVLEVLFVPFYLGSWLVPVVLPIAVVTNWFWVRLGHERVPATGGAVAPLVAWAVPVLGLTTVPQSEGDVLIAGNNAQQYVFYGLLLFGALSGFVSILARTGAMAEGNRLSR